MAINLGDINFGLGPDTRRLDEARKSVLQFGQAVNRAAQSQVEGARKAEQAMRRQEKSILSALQSTLKMNEALRRAGAPNQLIQQSTNAFNRLVKELGKGQVSALQFQRSMEDFQASTGRVNRELSRHQKALKDTERAQRDLERAAKQSANEQARANAASTRLAFQAARAQEQAILRQNAAIASAEAAMVKYNAQVARLKTNQQAVFAARGNEALNVFRTQLDAAGNSMIKFQQAQQNFKKSILESTTAMRNIQATGMEAMLRRMADVSILLHGPLSGIATRLTLISGLAGSVSLKMAALVTGISAGAFAFVQIARGAITASRAFEKVNQTLTALNASAVIGQIDLRYLGNIADRAGSQFDATAKQYARLTAASQGTNLEGERTRHIFENILFAAQKLGSTNEELEGTLRAVEQIMSKGQVQAEELRGQLGDRLPGAVNIMAEALGVTTAELNKLMKQGKLTSASLIAFSDTLAQRLGVNTSQAIDTVTAAENRVINALGRFYRSVNDTLKISTAYKNVLSGIVSVLDWLGRNIDTVAKGFAAVSGAIAGAMFAIYAPTVLSGLVMVLNTLRALTTAMLTFNAATLANPFGALSSIIIRLGAAITGAIVGFKLMDTVIGDTSNAHYGALPAVEEYIKAQAKLKHTIRDTTREYIAQQQVFLQGLKSQEAAVKKAADDARQWLTTNSPHMLQFIGTDIAKTNALIQNSIQGPKLEAIQRYTDLADEIKKTEQNLKDLEDILKRQEAEEKKRNAALGNGIGGGSGDSGTNRASNALKDALDAIKRLNEEYKIMQLPKWQQTFARLQLDINSSVEDFKDKLIRAKVPMKDVVTYTEQYAAALKKVEEGKYYIDLQIPAWEALATVLSDGMDQAMNSMVDALFEGQSMFESLREVGMSVAKDLVKTFLQLALINPLKNMLFGGSFSTGSPFPTLAFAKGGVVDSPTFFSMGKGLGVAGEAGKEAILPLARGANGALGVQAVGGSDQGSGPNELRLTVNVVGANGDTQIKQMVAEGVQIGIAQFSDKVLPVRVIQITEEPRLR